MFVGACYFHFTLILAGKAVAYPSGALFGTTLWGAAPSPYYKYTTMEQVTDSDKNSNLLRYLIEYGLEKF